MKEEWRIRKGEKKEKKEEDGAFLGTAHGAPHSAPLPIKARLLTASHSPSHASEIRQGAKRAIPSRQSRPFPLLKYLCEQRAAAARWLTRHQGPSISEDFLIRLMSFFVPWPNQIGLFSFLKSIADPPQNVFPITAFQK